ncbi:MAG: tetratricopeptide repeat-containing sensor histidine kinase [Chloroflexota bacterium]
MLVDTEKVRELNRQAWEARYHNIAEAQRLSEEAFTLAQAINDTREQALALRTLSYCMESNSAYDKAMQYGLQSLALLEELNDKEGLAYTNNILSRIYWDLGDYPNALEYNLQALTLAQAVGNRKLEAWIYNNIAMNYARLENYPKVAEMLAQALVIFQELAARRDIAMTYNNLAMLHFSTNNFDQALIEAEKGLRLARPSEHTDDIYDIRVHLLDTLGQIYTKLENYEQALTHLYASQRIAEEYNLKQEHAYAKLGIGRIYYQQAQYEQAIQETQSAITIGDALESQQLLLECHELLFDIYHAIGDFEQAVFHYKTYHKFHSHVFSEERDRRFARLEVRYRTEAAKKEALAYQQKNEELAQINTQLQQLHQEKDDLMSIVAHDLRSPLGGIKMSIDLLQNYGDRLGPEKRQKKLVQMDDTIGKMLDIITNLLENAQLNQPTIEQSALQATLQPTASADIQSLPPLQPATMMLTAEVELLPLLPILQSTYEQHEAGAAAKRILLQQQWNQDQRDDQEQRHQKIDMSHVDGGEDTHDITQPLMVLGNKTNLQQVLDNLLSNAIKYSYPDSTVTIAVSPHSSYVQIDVTDEGQGLSEVDKQKIFGRYTKLSAKPTAGESSIGLGLYSTKKLMEAMNGSIAVTSPGKDQGSTFSISLPVAPTTEQ